MPRPPRRAGPVWAWALALLVLIVLIVILLSRRERPVPADPPAAPAAETTAADEWDPAPRVADLAAIEALATAVPLGSLVPLGPAHTGVLVTFEGVAEGEVPGLGLRVRTDEGEAVFVRLLEPGGGAGVRAGPIAGRGVIRFDSDGLLAARLARPDVEPRSRAAGLGEYYIETTPSRIVVP